MLNTIKWFLPPVPLDLIDIVFFVSSNTDSYVLWLDLRHSFSEEDHNYLYNGNYSIDNASIAHEQMIFGNSDLFATYGIAGAPNSASASSSAAGNAHLNPSGTAGSHHAIGSGGGAANAAGTQNGSLSNERPSPVEKVTKEERTKEIENNEWIE